MEILATSPYSKTVHFLNRAEESFCGFIYNIISNEYHLGLKFHLERLVLGVYYYYFFG